MQLSAHRSATAVLAFSAALLVAGCGSGGSGGSAAGAPSAVASATGGSAPAASTPAASTPAAGTPAASVPATAAAASSAPAAATPGAASSAPAPAGGGSAAGTAAGCQNLTATAGVKAAVTAAYEAANPRFNHIQPAPGGFFYGSCGGTRYAATRFEVTAGADQNTLVGMQDEGSVRKYFSWTGSTGWGYTGSDVFPPAGGCPAQIPAGLVKDWADCPAG